MSTGTGTGTAAAGRARIAQRTLRTDRWWLAPLVSGLSLGIFLVYSGVRLFWDKSYFLEEFHYVAPFYSPCMSSSCTPGTSPLGTPIGSLPAWLSPAMIILVIPAGFRATCYYYRKSYYRSYWLSPPACAVAEPHKSYTGETRFPLVFQNVHRWFFYLAFLLIWAYTMGCHSCRSITGGRLTHFSKHPVRYWLWTRVSKLNERHGTFAFASMYSIMIADAYVWLVASGTVTDLRLFN